MGTRGVIARPLGDGWEGHYHHNSSNPKGLGKTLWDAYHGHFGRDVAAMQAYFIDAHPGAWSSVVNADFKRKPGFVDYGKMPLREDHADDESYERAYRKVMGRPRCFCHGDRSHNRDGADDNKYRNVDGKVGDDWDIEWVYVLHPAGMDVLTADDQGDNWTCAATVLWDRDEPDWEAVQQGTFEAVAA